MVQQYLPKGTKTAGATGQYRGQPANPDTVKFKTEFQGIPIHVDRPKGFVMTGKDRQDRPWSRKYLYDYGFIPKTQGGDGDGIDVFVGPDRTATTAFWAVQRKEDGSFDEYKVFVGFDNRDAAVTAYRQHIPKKLLAGMMAIKIDMMKAMIGLGPDGYQLASLSKAASAIGFLTELGAGP